MKKRILTLLLVGLMSVQSVMPVFAKESNEAVQNYVEDEFVLAAGESTGDIVALPIEEGAIDCVNDNIPTKQQVYDRILALQSEYPEGRRWTNADGYNFSVLIDGVRWKGYGCAGFAFICSDAGFGNGNLAARKNNNPTYDDIRVGDILRVNYGNHSVVCLEKYDDYVVVTEGNYNSSIHWFRKITKAELSKNGYLTYITTRWPEGYDPDKEQKPDPKPDPQPNPDPKPDDKKFDDVPADKWYAEAVNYVVSKGVMNGVADNLFAPLNTTKREMMVRIIYNMAGQPAVNGTNRFADVKSGAWYEKAVIWAADNNITSGKGNGSFGVGDDVTRQDVAALLYRYASNKGYDVSATGDLSKFNDTSAVSGYAVTAMQWAVGKGIISGTAQGNLNPKGNATRAEIAKMAMGFLKAYN